MVRNHTARTGRSKRESLEIFRRCARENEGWIYRETEAAIVRRLPQHYAASSAFFPKNAQRFTHQARAYAAALIRR